jgi:hypothetical protein
LKLPQKKKIILVYFTFIYFEILVPHTLLFIPIITYFDFIMNLKLLDQSFHKQLKLDFYWKFWSLHPSFHTPTNHKFFISYLI